MILERNFAKANVDEINIFQNMVAHERFLALAGEYTPDELEVFDQIIDVAAKSLLDECKVNKKVGFVIGVSKDHRVTFLTQLGSVNEKDNEYGGNKGKSIKDHDFARTKQGSLNQGLKISRSSHPRAAASGFRTFIKGQLVRGGAVSFDNGIKISISGLSSDPFDDEDAVLKIGKILGFKEATSDRI